MFIGTRACAGVDFSLPSAACNISSGIPRRPGASRNEFLIERLYQSQLHRERMRQLPGDASFGQTLRSLVRVHASAV